MRKSIGKRFLLKNKDKEKLKSIFYCKTCDFNFNDSNSFVEHLNGAKHNRILGMNMKV